MGNSNAVTREKYERIYETIKQAGGLPIERVAEMAGNKPDSILATFENLGLLLSQAKVEIKTDKSYSERNKKPITKIYVFVWTPDEAIDTWMEGWID